MTLEEAIKHAEEVVDFLECEASKYDMNDAFESHMACQDGKIAEEHRQLAEWLKELKQLREQTRWIPVSDPLNELPKDDRLLVTVWDEEYDYCYVTELCYDMTEWSDMNAAKNAIAYQYYPEPYKAESEGKMEYKGGTISIVEEGEKVDIVPKNKNSVEISYAVVFHDCGVYRVDVSDKRITITKEG